MLLPVSARAQQAPSIFRRPDRQLYAVKAAHCETIIDVGACYCSRSLDLSVFFVYDFAGYSAIGPHWHQAGIRRSSKVACIYRLRFRMYVDTRVNILMQFCGTTIHRLDSKD